MQANANSRVARKGFEERQVRLGIGPRENFVEISDGLMRMNEQDQVKLRHSLTPNRALRIALKGLPGLPMARDQSAMDFVTRLTLDDFAPADLASRWVSCCAACKTSASETAAGA